MTGEQRLINVFVVAASAVLRAGLEAILQADERFFAAGGAAEIRLAPLPVSGARAIDVLLVSIERKREFGALTNFPGGAPEQTEAENYPRVVALSAPDFQTTAQVAALLRAGARGVLPNDADAEEIRAAVFAAANNLTVAPPEIFDALIAGNFSGAANGEAAGEEIYENLTPRETEVLELLVEGESNKRIAARLGISEHTVKFHAASIFAKLGASTRTEAAAQAVRRGLVLL